MRRRFLAVSVSAFLVQRLTDPKEQLALDHVGARGDVQLVDQAGHEKSRLAVGEDVATGELYAGDDGTSSAVSARSGLRGERQGGGQEHEEYQPRLSRIFQSSMGLNSLNRCTASCSLHSRKIHVVLLGPWSEAK
jgi:hypothetical protein